MSVITMIYVHVNITSYIIRTLMKLVVNITIDIDQEHIDIIYFNLLIHTQIIRALQNYLEGNN